MSEDVTVPVFSVYVVENDNETYIEKYLLPSGQWIEFNRDKDTIDLSPMKEYLGQAFVRVINGVVDGVYKLIDITKVQDPNFDEEVETAVAEEIDMMVFDV